MGSYTPRIPTPGETLCGTSFELGNGGKGANQCVAAAKLGARCALVAAVRFSKFQFDLCKSWVLEAGHGININFQNSHFIEANKRLPISQLYCKFLIAVVHFQLGNDVFGLKYLEHLKGAGIDVKHVKLSEERHSGIAQITVTENGKLNNLMLYPGKNSISR